MIVWAYLVCVGINAGLFTIAELSHDEPQPKATWADYCRLTGMVLLGPVLWVIIGVLILTRRHEERAEDG